jgi:phytoene synthase
VDLETAYRHCEQVTWQRARNFSYGIRLLPPAKRRAMCAIYAMARRIDDIGDGQLPPEVKRARLAAVRRELAVRGGDADPVSFALSDAAARFPIPVDAFTEIVDGVEMDVDGATYVTFDELLHYCRCVAGSVGRLSLGVFGSTDPAAPGRADTLGVALQLTNILRDVAEDAANGRVYLPKEELTGFGCEPLIGGPPAAFARLVAFQAERAERWFEEGLRLLPLLDRRSAACVAAMAGIYRRLLARIADRPEAVLAGRVTLPPLEKAAIAIRCLAGRVTR